jgi:hypothetical protein
MSEKTEAVIESTTSAVKAAAHGHAVGDAHAACANCGTILAGPFCVQCGQAAHIHRSLLHLVEEVLHGVLHFDAKGWKTLPLLVLAPGRLTRDYIDGQRTKYVSPLALFLFLLFMSFFVASFVGKAPIDNLLTPYAPEQRQALADDYKERIAKARTAETHAQSRLANGSDPAIWQKAADAARAAIKKNEQELASLLAPTVSAPASAAAPPAKESNAVRVANQLQKNGWVHSDVPQIDAATKLALKNPDLAAYKIKNTAYKFSFLIVPISLPFLWLMFLNKPGSAMFDHAVFVLYSLCFMSLLFIAMVLLERIGWDALIPWMVALVPPVHIWAQLRGTYRIGHFAALWRTLVLLLVASFVMLFFILSVLVMSMR